MQGEENPRNGFANGEAKTTCEVTRYGRGKRGSGRASGQNEQRRRERERREREEVREVATGIQRRGEKKRAAKGGKIRQSPQVQKIQKRKCQV